MRPIHFISSFFFDKNKACDCASMAEAEHFSSLRAAKIKIFPPSARLALSSAGFRRIPLLLHGDTTKRLSSELHLIV